MLSCASIARTDSADCQFLDVFRVLLLSLWLLQSRVKPLALLEKEVFEVSLEKRHFPRDHFPEVTFGGRVFCRRLLNLPEELPE